MQPHTDQMRMWAQLFSAETSLLSAETSLPISALGIVQTTRPPRKRSMPPRNAGEGRRYHAHCGCTIEEVFGSSRPRPNPPRTGQSHPQRRGSARPTTHDHRGVGAM